MSNAPHVHKPHDWQRPLPGQGGLKVCRRCGARNLAGTDEEECSGVDPERVMPTKHEFDPYDG